MSTKRKADDLSGMKRPPKSPSRAISAGSTDGTRTCDLWVVSWVPGVSLARLVSKARVNAVVLSDGLRHVAFMRGGPTMLCSQIQIPKWPAYGRVREPAIGISALPSIAFRCFPCNRREIDFGVRLSRVSLSLRRRRGHTELRRHTAALVPDEPQQHGVCGSSPGAAATAVVA